MNDVEIILNKQPFKKLYEGPSPIIRLDKLERKINSRYRIWIKREDQLRFLYGNKIRYLEYVLGLYELTTHGKIYQDERKQNKTKANTKARKYTTTTTTKAPKSPLNWGTCTCN